MIACEASASVWFRSKKSPRNVILGFGRARNETRAKKNESGRSSFSGAIFRAAQTLVPLSLLLYRTETLATQAMCMRLFQTPLFLKNEESIVNKSIKGSKTPQNCYGIPQKEVSLMRSLASLRRRYTLFMYKLYRILQKEFAFSQKEVHFIMYNL